MPLYIAKKGDLDRCHRCLTDSLTHSHLKDRATQLLIKYKSGALVTQLLKTPNNCYSCDHGNPSSFIWSIVGLGGRPRANQKVELPTFQLCNST